jgi:hypothetical protein
VERDDGDRRRLHRQVDRQAPVRGEQRRGDRDGLERDVASRDERGK